MKTVSGIAYELNDYTGFRKQVRNYGVLPLFGFMYLDNVWIAK